MADLRDVLIFAYKAFDGSIRGKTLLQKRIYFLSVMLGLDMGYEAHFYGPYSERVNSANMELKSLGYVTESCSTFGLDQRGFEMTRYDFALSDAGKRLAERKAAKDPQLWSHIQSASTVVKNAGDLDYMELSIAAKAYFVLNKLNGKATMASISAMLPKFGWTVSPQEVQKATEFLTKAGLVSRI